MSTQSQANISDFFGQFSADNLKQDDSRNVLLVEQRSELKEAVSPKTPKGEQIIRKKARRLGLRLQSKDVKEITEELDAMAWDYEQKQIASSIRYALSGDGESSIIDLNNGHIVQLNAEKVEVLDTMPTANQDVYFSRPSFQLEMMKPDLSKENFAEGLKKLRQFINTDTNTFFLVVAYITYLMAHPKAKGVPYPILMIQGEKGAGKSFFCNNVLRGLVDPSSISALALTRKQDDFVITINGMFLAVFDNLRSLTKAQSDLLCTTATKGSTAKRTLYTTSELTLMELHSPLVLNGIHDFVKESDLASRCLRVSLHPMKEQERRAEQELKADLAAAMPEIFGSLLKLASKSMAELPNVEVKYAARMMDFSKWLAALERVLNNIEEGQLQKVYRANVKALMASGTADDSLTIALKKLIEETGKGKAWKSSSSALLSKLNQFEDSMYLPKGAGALSAKIKGQESSLNANGIFFKIGRDADRYIAVSDTPFN
ncbi:ATP-binding protein [Vibrio splendidus]|uniref:ATP-binding protein n=1 Tax=Vibrio crassostreae TaxID=246167 RepID=UPI00352EDE8D